MMAVWTDDPTVLPPDAPGLRGRAAVRAWAQAFHERVRVVDAAFTESEVTIAGELATERLVFTMTVQPAGGSPETIEGKGVHVYRRQADGSWKLSLDIWNGNAPSRPR